MTTKTLLNVASQAVLKFCIQTFIRSVPVGQKYPTDLQPRTQYPSQAVFALIQPLNLRARARYVTIGYPTQGWAAMGVSRRRFNFHWGISLFKKGHYAMLAAPLPSPVTGSIFTPGGRPLFDSPPPPGSPTGAERLARSRMASTSTTSPAKR